MDMTVPASAAAFDGDARDYDAQRRALVPCFDNFYGAVVDWLADGGLPANPRILDLGAGTGLVSSWIKRRWPAAELHLLDASDGMFTAARARFRGADGIHFLTGDMAHAALGGPWDAVVSALAIHHLEHDGKRDLFRRIHEALAPGGFFVNAEQILAPDPGAEARNDRFWVAAAKGLGATDADIAAARERMRHDRCATVEDQLAWLREAGFQEVDCAFKSWRFAVLGGRKEVA